MNNNTRPPTLATIIQMPAESIAQIFPTSHPRNPHGRTLTLTLTFPITLEISINPDGITHIIAQAA